MPILTGVPTTSRVPQTFHRMIYSAPGGALTPIELRSLLIGVGKGGSAVSGQIYAIDDTNQADTLFGVGTELNLMVKKAIETCRLLGKGPTILAVQVAENAAGTAGIFSGTVTGTATESGNLVTRFAGVLLTVPVSLGDNASTVAAALNVQFNANKANLPATSTVLAGVVTATMTHKGDYALDVKHQVVSSPAGITLAWTNPTPGAGVNDPTAALAAALTTDYDTIALANHKAADVTLALAHVTAAWGYSEKKWRHVVFGENGSIGTAVALMAPANDKAITMLSCFNCQSLPSQMAAAYAMAISSRSRPNANWDRLQLPLAPPLEADSYTNTQAETALAGGLTPARAAIVNGVIRADRVEIVKAVTSQITQSGQPFEILRDLAVPRAAAYVARQLDAAYAAAFNGDNYPDGVLLDDDVEARITQMAAEVLYACQDFKVVRNVAVDLAALKVERDNSAPGRINIDITYTVVIGLHQVAFVHRVTI